MLGLSGSIRLKSTLYPKCIFVLFNFFSILPQIFLVSAFIMLQHSPVWACWFQGFSVAFLSLFFLRHLRVKTSTSYISIHIYLYKYRYKCIFTSSKLHYFDEKIQPDRITVTSFRWVSVDGVMQVFLFFFFYIMCIEGFFGDHIMLAGRLWWC